MFLFGNDYKESTLRDRVGDMSQLGGFRSSTLNSGFENGTRIVNVRTCGGLAFDIVPDRGMNICNVWYKGIPMDWSSGTGIRNPKYYDSSGWNWLRSFNGGLVHTCGLSNIGGPIEDDCMIYDNRRFGGHGSIGNTPAENVHWDDSKGDYVFSGSCLQVSATEEKLLFKREIRTSIESSGFTITDKVKNLGIDRTPVFLLYHCNFGFPLLSESSLLRINAAGAEDEMGRPASDFLKLSPPTEERYDKLYYPKITEKSSTIELFNPDLTESGLGMRISYSTDVLKHLTIWKFFQKRHYVLGLEPGTCRVGGRVEETEQDRALFLNKDEELELNISFTVTEGKTGLTVPEL